MNNQKRQKPFFSSWAAAILMAALTSACGDSGSGTATDVNGPMNDASTGDAVATADSGRDATAGSTDASASSADAESMGDEQAALPDASSRALDAAPFDAQGTDAAAGGDAAAQDAASREADASCPCVLTTATKPTDCTTGSTPGTYCCPIADCQ